MIPILLFVTVIFQHFQIASISGYPLTVGALTGCMLIVALGRPFKAVTTIVTLAFVVPLSFVTLVANGIPGDEAGYERTVFLAALAAAIISQSFRNQPLVLSDKFVSSVLASLAVVVALSAVQAVSGAVGVESFFNPFGNHQYLYQYRVFLAPGRFPRAQGFYLEPSYDAFVIGSLAVILLVSRRHVRKALVLAVVGLLSTQSATGLIIICAILALFALRSNVKYGLLGVLGAAAVTITSSQYLGDRLRSISETSSSANYRLVAPLEVVQNILGSSVLGEPLGSISRVMGSYSLSNGDTVGTSLDNGAYVLIFYFGWLGILALLVLTLWALRIFLLSYKQRDSTWIGAIWLVCSLLFSGGILLPEYCVMTGLVIFVMTTAKARCETAHSGDGLAHSYAVSSLKEETS